MTIENFCEFIRKIYNDPSAKITDLKISEFQALRNHLQSCLACAILVDEVLEKYQDVKTDDSTRWN